MLMTNFDFLKEDSNLSFLADFAISAEQLFNQDYSLSVITCKTAVENTIKWLYTVDSSLVYPWDKNNFNLLINTDEFKKLVGDNLYKRLNYIRIVSNNAKRNKKKITKEQTIIAIENLFVFMDFVCCCYSKNYQKQTFSRDLLVNSKPKQKTSKQDFVFDVLEQNQETKDYFSNIRRNRRKDYKEIPIDPTEQMTRQAYIDVMLEDVGWVLDKDWQNEYPIEDMPNKTGIGFADYVLFGDDGIPLAVVEAKKTSVSVEQGRQQAKLYADFLEKKFNKRPIIFLTNGYDTRIIIDQENGYPERKVFSVYSKRDLEQLFHKLKEKSKLDFIKINNDITNRDYQKEAIKTVCETFDKYNKRKALLVMATGSGKTRTVISLVDVLIQNGWVKNFLFLADRNALVRQAKGAFQNLLPNLSITNLVEDKQNYNARGVFSTYQTMQNCIDNVRDEDNKKLYTCGHFDLIILDEAHRSIYNKYKDIFNYFDSLLVGLTATPKNEIDKNTYQMFDLVDVPTYSYDLAQAVEEGYLVSYQSIETKLNLIENGVVYEELTEQEKQDFDELFSDDETKKETKVINPSEFNKKIFNEDTIKKVLDILLTKCLKIDYGNRIGKTIIFAKNHLHAEKILEIWNKIYPYYPQGFCQVIDNTINYAQTLIDDFSKADSFPQIAISVDMLDTGIDVPEILNLVFFKKVLSVSKFWQMIGRGTRLCPGLIDGNDKYEFYIFDFCSNFEFFRVEKNRKDNDDVVKTIQEQIFNLKFYLAFKLQDIQFQTQYLINFRNELVKYLLEKTKELDRTTYTVRQHLKFVDRYSNLDSYKILSYKDVVNVEKELALLMQPIEEEPTALRFDALMYQIEISVLEEKDNKIFITDLIKKCKSLEKYGTIPEVLAQKELIQKIAFDSSFIKNIKDIEKFENIRIKLRNLIKYIQNKEDKIYNSNFKDVILELNQNGPDFYSTDDNYKKKVEFYFKQHQDNFAVMKIKYNKPINKEDIKELEKILWHDLGTQKDYEREYENKSFGELVRSIVGLDRQTVQEIFSQFIDDKNLDSKQIYFVRQVVNYIVKNGCVIDFNVLLDTPFNDVGSISDIFENDMNLWHEIVSAIEQINSNAGILRK